MATHSRIFAITILINLLISNVTAQCAIQGICYALDWSGSVDDTEYTSSRNFAVNSAREFETTGVSTEYSAAGFAGSASTIQEGTTNLEGVFIPVILNHTRGGGSTDIYTGLSQCASLIPTSGPRVIITITDGQGSSGSNPAPALKAAGVVLVTIGVGGGVNVPFLQNLATSPDLYFPATFDMLPSLAINVTAEACQFTTPVPTPTPAPVPTPNPNCNIQGICYALDQSGSITVPNYSSSRDFTVNSARAFNTPGVVTEYSAAGFTGFANTIQSGTTDLEGVFVPAIQTHIRSTGGTNIYAGIAQCGTLLPTSGPRVIVTITDGMGVSGTNPVPVLKGAGVVFVTIGVGAGVDITFLQNLATTPNLYFNATFDMLPTLADDVKDEACKNIITPPVGNACQDAFDKCEFTIDDSKTIPKYNISNPPDVAILPVTKKDGKSLGVINADKFEPQFIFDNGTAVEISKFGNQPFSPTTFKTELIAKTPTSGVAHESFQGDQFWIADDQCVRVFINSYQLLLPNGQVTGNINIDTKSNEKCVVFNTLQ